VKLDKTSSPYKIIVYNIYLYIIMVRIGLISDTHSYLDPKIEKYFASCDEIWHVGDVGNIDVIKQLTKIKPVRGVYGNIDGQEIRKLFPKHLKFTCDTLVDTLTDTHKK